MVIRYELVVTIWIEYKQIQQSYKYSSHQCIIRWTVSPADENTTALCEHFIMFWHISQPVVNLFRLYNTETL